MKIGLCQLEIVWEDKASNRLKVGEFTQKAVEQSVELLLFPEMTLTGFSMNTRLTVEGDEETVDYFKVLSSKHNINIGFGWAESFKDKARNHYTVVSGEGEVISDFVKLHPFSFGGEDKYFYPGDKVVTFSIGLLNIATFICYDLRFPEMFQSVSKAVNLIIVPANWPEPRKQHWRTLLQARAIENQVYMAGVNCVGEKGGLNYSGNTMLVDPEGNIMGELENNEGLLCFDVDRYIVDAYRRSFPLKNDRRTAFYKSIL